MQLTTSRKQAHQAGKTRYYTGRPCNQGHDAERYVSTGGCVKCGAERSKDFATSMRRTHTARVQGLFTYALHPDDHAAALAFCQALDMGRGNLPQQPVTYDVAANRTPPSHEELMAQRRQLFPNLFPDEPEPYMPKL